MLESDIYSQYLKKDTLDLDLDFGIHRVQFHISGKFLYQLKR